MVLCCASSLSCVLLFVTPWTVARWAPLSMGFSRQKLLEWAAMPSSKGSSQPRDQTQVSGIEPRSPSLQSESLLSEPTRKPKNTGVGSPALRQGIFLTQELEPPALQQIL